jgi:hypothetical protein
MVPVKDLWAAIRPTQKSANLARELSDFIQTLRKKFDTFITRMTHVLDSLIKLNQGEFMEVNYDRLTEALVFQGFEGKPELEIQENTDFFKKLQFISQQLTVTPSGTDTIKIDPTPAPESDEVKVTWHKKEPAADENAARTLEMFLASRLDLHTIKGSAKLDIVSPQEMAIKYSGGSAFKVVFQGGYKRILFKIKYSLTPKREVLQFFLVPKSHLEFLSSPEMYADEIKALSFVRLETFYLKNTKQVHDRGFIFAFEQSKERLLVLLNDRNFASDSRLKINKDDDYVLVMAVVATDPNNMYFYIENKYQYKPI